MTRETGYYWAKLPGEPARIFWYAPRDPNLSPIRGLPYFGWRGADDPEGDDEFSYWKDSEFEHIWETRLVPPNLPENG